MTLNSPPIEPGQIWVTRSSDPDEKPLRRLRILAVLPSTSLKYRSDDVRQWIFEELDGAVFRTEIGRLGILPEFNLRYSCELEQNG